MEDSVYTKILRGERSAPIVDNGKLTFTMLDENPLTKGHALVITKRQVDHLDDCSEEEHAELFEQVHKISKILKELYRPKRIGLVVHGFEIPHAHIHVVPLYTGNEMHFLAAKDREHPSMQDLQIIRNDIMSFDKGV